MLIDKPPADFLFLSGFQMSDLDFRLEARLELRGLGQLDLHPVEPDDFNPIGHLQGRGEKAFVSDDTGQVKEVFLFVKRARLFIHRPRFGRQDTHLGQGLGQHHIEQGLLAGPFLEEFRPRILPEEIGVVSSKFHFSELR